MRVSKILRTAFAATIVVGGLMIAAPAAQADPGFCGVRDSMGQNNGDSEYYIVRNQCARVVPMRVVLQGHEQVCKSVPANGYAAWESSVYFDQNWYILAC